MDRVEYKTKQKELIMDFLCNSKANHVTIDEVLKYLHSEGNTVGRTTIYRYMETLVSQGVLRKYFIEEGLGACYEYIGNNVECSQHFHLKCVQCGQLFHVKCTELEELDNHLSEHHEFKIDHRKTVIYGLCKNCGGINGQTQS